MRLPQRKELKRRLAGVGWHLVQQKGGQIRFHHPQTRIDLGGLVKEYAVDSAAAVLSALGVRRGIVNLGGDIRVVGPVPASKRPFQVGMAHPRRHHGIACTLSLREGAVVTSGDYQRFFLRDGKRYHHLIDPSTGFPLALRYTGVTAHAPTALAALMRVKCLLFGTEGNGGENEGSFVGCNEMGDPETWRESAACRIRMAAA